MKQLCFFVLCVDEAKLEGGFLGVGAKQPVHGFLGGRIVVIQQGTSVWGGLPSFFLGGLPWVPKLIIWLYFHTCNQILHGFFLLL